MPNKLYFLKYILSEEKNCRKMYLSHTLSDPKLLVTSYLKNVPSICRSFFIMTCYMWIIFRCSFSVNELFSFWPVGCIQPELPAKWPITGARMFWEAICFVGEKRNKRTSIAWIHRKIRYVHHSISYSVLHNQPFLNFYPTCFPYKYLRNFITQYVIPVW